MRRVWMWFLLSGKRYLCRSSFLLILLSLPLGTFLIRSGEKKEPARISIALCAQLKGEEEEGPGDREEPLERQLAGALVRQGEEGGLFRFYVCENEEQVREEVASRRAECGYVLGAGLREMLRQKEFKRSIQVYSAPSTVAAKLSAETVFAAMIELYDRELFREYVVEAAGVAPALADQTYDRWKENGSTFHFTYEVVSRREDAHGAAVTDSVFPVRGLAAVYVFVIGLYGAAMSLADERRGLFRAIPCGWRTPCRMAAMASPVCLAALSGLAALWTGKCNGEGMREMTVMAAYVMAVILFSWGVRLVCRREAAVCCLIPLFLVGSLVFCPVFLDIRRYVPELGFWEKLFLPGYYLRGF